MGQVGDYYDSAYSSAEIEWLNALIAQKDDVISQKDKIIAHKDVNYCLYKESVIAQQNNELAALKKR